MVKSKIIIITITSVTLFLLALVACAGNHKIQQTTSESPPKEGMPDIAFIDINRVNLINGGFLCEDENYYYYSKDYDDKSSLIKLSKTTNQPSTLINQIKGTINNINITDEYVYYTNLQVDPVNQTASSIAYSINKNGGEPKKLFENAGNLMIYNGYAYHNKNNGLYSYNLQTGNEIKVLDGTTSSMSIIDNKLYCCKYNLPNVNNDVKLIEYDLITSENKILANVNGSVRYVQYYDNKLYFGQNFDLYEYDIESGQAKVIASRQTVTQRDAITGLSITSGGIYFISNSLNTDYKYASFTFCNADTEKIMDVYKDNSVLISVMYTKDYVIFLSRDIATLLMSYKVINYKGEVVGLSL